MHLFLIKGAVITDPSLNSWKSLFKSSSELLMPIINKGSKSKFLVFHYSNEETLPTGLLSWTNNFSLNRKDIEVSTDCIPHDSYKYVYIALITLEDDDDINEISSTVSQTRIGGYEILLNLNDEQRTRITRFPITMFD